MNAARNATIQFDRDLIRHYDGFGPRYTSYPTAAQFRPHFTTDAYRAAALQSNCSQPPSPLSIYVHIPFCASPCFYCGCSKVITRSAGKVEAYLGRLATEIELQGEMFDEGRTVRQLHLGGGTPTFLSAGQLASLLGALRRSFRLSDASDREYSIEIDPRTAGPGSIEALAALGFNRVSLGVQDYDPEVQRAVNRVQSPEETESVIERSRAAGFRSISVDLIYGLPLQTPPRFSVTLDRLIRSRPDRVAVYAYAHLPRMFKAQRRIRESDLPDSEMRLELLGLTIEKLIDAGYDYVGMDHFALPEDELIKARDGGTLHRNFQGYSTHAQCDIVGLGVTAIGHVGETFTQNQKSLADYERAVAAGRLPVHRGLTLTDDDRVRAAVIQELMCYGRVSGGKISQRFHVDFEDYFADELVRLKRLENDGLVRLRADVIDVTPTGRLLLRNVAMVFDAYLKADTVTPMYSRAI
jgi:oxygen-independent coproporphyrinogen III oxidase